MENKSAQLRAGATKLIERCEALDRLAEAEQRSLSESEQLEFDTNLAESARLRAAAERAAQLEIGGLPAFEPLQERAGAPNLNLRTRRGDGETRALAHYLRTGDRSALTAEMRVSNATDMNITTMADGGYAVPVGHYQGIIAKRNEMMIAGRLGVMRVPGVGTTVNVPVESGTAQPAVQTAEAAAYDLDAPVLGQVPMTLRKFTKQIQISEELLYDEDSQLIAFLNDYVGRAFALAHNNALVTEVLGANGGTNLPLTGSAAAAGHIPALVGGLADEYAENAKFLMSRSTEYAYRALQGAAWVFENTPAGGPVGFWGFPIVHSAFMPSIAALAETIVFGDFSQVGMRENPQFEFLRDPYSNAKNGQVNLWYRARFSYRVLNRSALLIGTLA